jgi:hypothetical protein
VKRSTSRPSLANLGEGCHGGRGDPAHHRRGGRSRSEEDCAHVNQLGGGPRGNRAEDNCGSHDEASSNDGSDNGAVVHKRASDYHGRTDYDTDHGHSHDGGSGYDGGCHSYNRSSCADRSYHAPARDRSPSRALWRSDEPARLQLLR